MGFCQIWSFFSIETGFSKHFYTTKIVLIKKYMMCKSPVGQIPICVWSVQMSLNSYIPSVTSCHIFNIHTCICDPTIYEIVILENKEYKYKI